MNQPVRHFSLLLLLPICAYAQIAPPSPEEESVQLEKHIVQGQPIENYRATDALTGTKIGAALRDLPLSINIVPRQLIEDRRLTFLSEALDNVSGAQRKLGYGGTQNFGAIIRGFDSGFVTLRNGFRDFGFYTLRDTANVERFEVLKGPASILYGNLQPGGITNTLTKRPSPRPVRRATVVAGDFDFYRGEVDLGGPLTDQLFYRANFAYENSGSFRDGVENQSEFVAPVVTWLLTPDTTLTVEVEYKHSDYTWDLGLLRNPASFNVPISRFLGEPGAKNDVQSAAISSVLEHRINANWKLRQNLQTAYSGGDYELRSPTSLAADQRTVNRVAYSTDEKSENYSIQHELVGNFDTGALAHQAILGLDLNRATDGYDFFLSPLAPIDLYAPVYGAQPGPGGYYLFATESERDNVGVFFQDLVTLHEKVKLLAGARYDRVVQEDYNRLTHSFAPTRKDEGFSPQVGLVFQPTAGTSLYASYSTSFFPISGRTFSGGTLEPEEGEQFEIGAKQTLLGGRASLTTAAFWITKQNVSTPDPVNVGFRVQTAEQKSQGVEFDLTGSILTGWDMVVTGAYIDAFVSRDNTFAVGSALPSAPEWSGSVWSKYTLASGAAKGFGFGAGVYSASKRQAALPNSIWLPSYTRFDAAIYYGRRSWTLQLNVKNVTDERIYNNTGTTIIPQQPRAFLVSGGYTF